MLEIQMKINEITNARITNIEQTLDKCKEALTILLQELREINNE